MLHFKNIAHADYYRAVSKVDRKIPELIHRYSQIECTRVNCNHSDSLIEVGWHRERYYYKFPMTCCREFENELFYLFLDECYFVKPENWLYMSMYD